MPSFDSIYPMFEVFQEPKEYLGIVKYKAIGPCLCCGKMTDWFDYCMDAWVCSTECNYKMEEQILKGYEL